MAYAAGYPVRDYQTVLETIAQTTTDTGLTVTAYLDTNTYPTGVEVSEAELVAVPITRQPFHGK